MCAGPPPTRTTTDSGAPRTTSAVVRSGAVLGVGGGGRRRREAAVEAGPRGSVARGRKEAPHALLYVSDGRPTEGAATHLTIAGRTRRGPKRVAVFALSAHNTASASAGEL
jgi:hypothetical protein